MNVELGLVERTLHTHMAWVAGLGLAGAVSILATVVDPRCSPARARHWAMRTLPIVGPALGRGACHPGIFDAHLLLNKEDFLGEAGNPSRARIGGIGLSAGCGQGQPGQGDGVDGSRADLLGLVLWKWQGRNGLLGHESPLQES